MDVIEMKEVKNIRYEFIQHFLMNKEIHFPATIMYIIKTHDIKQLVEYIS